MNQSVDVAIVGAGPYGLSLAAHLRGRGIDYRQFGQPMALWADAMPAGMFLKSQGFASNLSAPERATGSARAGGHTLGAYCASAGLGYADYGRPVELDTFVSYGQWFQRTYAPDVDETLVASVGRAGTDYRLTLTDGRQLGARRVVVATGVEHFAHRPPLLAGLPPELCSHSSAHADLTAFAGRRVVVVGAGQSALETAALLAEGGARVWLAARTPDLVWNGQPLPPQRSLARRLREPEAGLGSGWATWCYSELPREFRHLPASTRIRRARTALGPAGAPWLRDRFENGVSALAGHTVVAAAAHHDEVRLTLRGGGSDLHLTADHVIAATGYPPNLDRLSFLDPELRASLRTLGGAPWVDAGFQSSRPGLYFAGPAVASSFGPVMRFVYGADFAATVLARRLAGAAVAHRSSVSVGVRP